MLHLFGLHTPFKDKKRYLAENLIWLWAFTCIVHFIHEAQLKHKLHISICDVCSEALKNLQFAGNLFLICFSNQSWKMAKKVNLTQCNLAYIDMQIPKAKHPHIHASYLKQNQGTRLQSKL